MRYFSTFSGIGGFELGIQQAYEDIQKLRVKNEGQSERSSSGGPQGQSKQLHKFSDQGLSCIGFSEIDKYATQIYQKHFPNHKNYGDITKINEKELPQFDFLVGGFPCQSFSIAGKRGGFEDTRGTMFFEIARIVREKQPRLLLLENVKGLLSHDKGATFYTIIATLDELGYDVQWQVLNSKNHGVPQNRERVFIIGYLRGTPRPEVFPFGEANSNITEGEGGRRQPFIQNPKMMNYKKDYDNSVAITATSYKEPPVVNAIRRLTPTECERLQGFPDGWTEGVSDTQRYKTLGNAVTVNVIRDIIKKLYALD